MFADYVATTYSYKSFKNQASYPYDISQSSNIHISFIAAETVRKNLLSIQSSPTPGPVGIPTCIRHCSENLSGPVKAIFNKSIELGYFPTAGNKSFIIPLFKAGNKLEVSNYRGIRSKIECNSKTLL